jgi:hypothetical protein
VPDATNSVVFTVSGPAQFVSPSTTRAEAGIATVLIRSSVLKPGRLSLRASVSGLKSAGLKLNSVQ